MIHDRPSTSLYLQQSISCHTSDIDANDDEPPLPDKLYREETDTHWDDEAMEKQTNVYHKEILSLNQMLSPNNLHTEDQKAELFRKKSAANWTNEDMRAQHEEMLQQLKHLHHEQKDAEFHGLQLQIKNMKDEIDEKDAMIEQLKINLLATNE